MHLKFLYHKIPSGMQGDILYPLNVLKNISPEHYNTEVAKYIGREHIMNQKVPILECLWNDVLHLSAINPDEIANALKQCDANSAFGVQYYQIDPFILERDNAVIYTRLAGEKIDCSPYNPERIAEISALPEVTKEYYKDEIANNRRPLVYYQTPHILYQGSIDISKCAIKTIH